MAQWRNWLKGREKKRLAWLEKRLKEISEEIRRMRFNANQRMARAKRKGEGDDNCS